VPTRPGPASAHAGLIRVTRANPPPTPRRRRRARPPARL